MVLGTPVKELFDPKRVMTHRLRTPGLGLQHISAISPDVECTRSVPTLSCE